MQFFEHDIENVCMEQQQHSEDKSSHQVEDMVAMEVVVMEDVAVGASQTADQDHKIMGAVMMMAMRTRVTKKERKSLNLILLGNSMLTHAIP